jgi:hypothetical protein
MLEQAEHLPVDARIHEGAAGETADQAARAHD